MAVVDTDRVVASVARRAIALFWPILTPTRRVGVNSIFVAVIDTNELVAIDTAFLAWSIIITLNAHAKMKTLIKVAGYPK